MREQPNQTSPHAVYSHESSHASLGHVPATDMRQSGEKTPSPMESTVQEIAALVVSAAERADEVAARARVDKLRAAHPDATADELVEILIRKKCVQAGAVGAATSSAALVPGLGTLASLTVGMVADVGVTMKLQLDLVLEIAHVYAHQFGAAEKQQTLLLVAGIGVGSERLLYRYGVQLTEEAGERFAGRALARAIPLVGMAASAALDTTLTYLVGKRAQAYFKLEPSGVPDWSASLRAITGVDERKLARWTQNTSATTWRALQRSASAVGEMMRGAARSSAAVVRSRSRDQSAVISQR